MLLSLFSTINTKIDQYLRYRRTVRELQLLTDRDLVDLGISRCDIDFIARNAVRFRP
jgi:uncharacterized protein YjiS (DUF1127 family)